MKIWIFALLSGVAFAPAAQSQEQVTIGVLTDMSGYSTDVVGKGSVTAAKMAAQDFGDVLGKPVKILFADHQNKPDIGVAIARQWFDSEGVSAIVDLAGSGVALAVQEMAKAKSKVALLVAPASSDLTGKSCSPFGVHWVYDTYAMANGTAAAITKQGYKDWFFITADFAFGHSLEKEASAVVLANGGTVKGSVRHPLGSVDMASYVLQAQASGAQVVGLANGTADAVNTLKSAHQFSGNSNTQRYAALNFYINDVHSLGLQDAQGVIVTSAFYWDQNEQTRAFGKRFFEIEKKMPSMNQAGDYSAVNHYLKAVKQAGTTDATAVMKAMRELPVNDFMTKDGWIRKDGRLMRDLYLFQVKSPAESKYPWDYYTQLRVIPANEAFRPIEQSECPLAKGN